MNNDIIIIKELCIWCKIGINSKEKIRKQPLFLDLYLFSSLEEACRTDKIEDTINYSTVCKEVILISNEEYNLIETLAYRIIVKLKEKFSINKVKIEIRKPRALTEECAKYAAIIIER